MHLHVPPSRVVKGGALARHIHRYSQHVKILVVTQFRSCEVSFWRLQLEFTICHMQGIAVLYMYVETINGIIPNESSHGNKDVNMLAKHTCSCELL